MAGETGPGPDVFGSDSLPALSMESEGSAHPFAAPEEERYRTEHVLGWGGMGKVEAVTDRRLDRQVAIKRAAAVHQGDPRLAQEALITAQLEHPGIVPVYDAGEDEHGRPWYAMRLIRGQTLREAVRSGEVDRRRLVRHFLAACEAVGYAHHEGVIHRDLKPANILVGAFGETQVVDWGLARPLDRRLGLPAQVHTVQGSVIGTPAYMSPEQAAGRETDRRSDVWSLGATLFELLSGEPPYEGEADSVLRRILALPPPKLDDPGLPPELVAIVTRAMQPEPHERYADAQEMAADVERWLTGARVQAHTYSSGELLTRFVVARRAALAVAAVAFAALGVGALRLMQERDRAVDAEQVAASARDASDANLAQSLVAQALAAQAAGAQPEAEVLAAAALRLTPDEPRARGILAAFSATGSPQLDAVLALPDCDIAALAPDGKSLACQHSEQLTLFDREGDAFVERWSKRGAGGRVTFTHPERVVVHEATGDAARLDVADGRVLDLVNEFREIGRPVQSGPDEILWWSGGDGIRISQKPRTPQFHWDGRIGALARQPDGPILIAGVDGGLHAFSTEDDVRLVVQTSLRDAFQADHLWIEGDLAVLGGLRGRVAVVDLDTETVLREVTAAGGNVLDARVSPDRSLLAIAGERGTIEVFRMDTGARVAQLPGAGVWTLRFTGDGALETYSEAVRRWQLPDGRPRHWQADAGITTVMMSKDGQQLAASTGAGTVEVWDAVTGAQRWTLDDGPLVIKAVDFSPDGHQLAYPSYDPRGVTIVDLVSGERTGIRLPGYNYRRLRWVADLLIGTSYAMGPHIHDLSEGVDRKDLVQIDAVMVDLRASADDTVVGMMDAEGGVWRMATSRPLSLTRIAQAASQSQVAVDSVEQRFAVADADAVQLLDASDGAVLATLDGPGQRVFDLSFSPDGSLLVAGLLDGSVQVWEVESRAVVAQLIGHRQRVSSLQFTPDGSGLLTASWDGSVRLWGLEVLGAPSDVLGSQIEQRWGLTLDDALRGALR